MAFERPTDWSGVYFGVGSGYQWSSIDVLGPGIGIGSDHSEGILSAHLGVQHQFGNIVLGVEGGWMSSIRDSDGSNEFCDSITPVLTLPIIAGGPNCSAKFNDVLTIGARLGLAQGHWMPYVTGGYANGGFDFTARGIAVAPIARPVIEQAHARLGGWYAGVGFDWVVSPGWTAGIEYRHYDFGSEDVVAFAPGGAPLELVRFEPTLDTITARVSWKWGREAAAPKPLK